MKDDVNATALLKLLAAVAPVDGISIGNADDRSTWRVWYRDGATLDHVAAADAVIKVYDPLAPSGVMVNVERDRRLSSVMFLGRSFGFCDGRGSDQNIAGAVSVALSAIISGVSAGDLRWFDPGQDFAWIAADNAPVPMDAQTVVAFGKSAASWKASHIYAGRSLKNMSPIPADYTADIRWPKNA